jgi:Ribbon-helix-helix protein, copG family
MGNMRRITRFVFAVMTITVKLEAPLEHLLRQRAAMTGQTTSDVLRAALRLYLDQVPPQQPTALGLGAGLFGRFAGSEDLSSRRKQVLDEIWGEGSPPRAKAAAKRAR